MNLDDMFGDGIESADNRIDAEMAIKKLGHLDRAILYLWVVGHTQAEIGAIVGLSQSQVCRILADMHKKCA